MQEILGTQIVTEQDAGELGERVVHELMDIIQELEGQEGTRRKPKTTPWAYRIPCQGVRYYSYE